METQAGGDWRSQSPPLSELTWRLLDVALSHDSLSSWALPEAETAAMRHTLVRLALDHEALAWHVRCLQRLRRFRGSAWPDAWTEPLPELVVQEVLEVGVSALETQALCVAILNPVALHQLAEAVDEVMPDAWLKLMGEHGELLVDSSFRETLPIPRSSPGDARDDRSPLASPVPQRTPSAEDAQNGYRRERWAWLAACAALLLAVGWLGAARVELADQLAMLQSAVERDPSPPPGKPSASPLSDTNDLRLPESDTVEVRIVEEQFVPNPDAGHIGFTGERRLAFADTSKNNLDNTVPELAKPQSNSANSAGDDNWLPGNPFL